MNFSFTDEQEAIRETVARFAKEEIGPRAEEDDRESRFPEEVFSKMRDLSLFGIITPTDYDGAGLDYMSYTIVLEELARYSAAVAVSLSVTNFPQAVLVQHGSEELKKRYLPPLATGETLGALAITEPNAGSDAGAIGTTATKQGDKYVLNGTKVWITNGGKASLYVVTARTGGPGSKGVSTFLVAADDPGFKIGKHEDKMGLRASQTTEILLENCEVPQERRLGEENKGFEIVKNALYGGRISIGAIANGIARAGYEEALEYAKERKQFGVPIVDFQGIGFMLADMRAGIDASKLLVQKAAWLRDQKLPYMVEASIAKRVATDNAMQVTTDAVQVFGGYGYTKEYPVERYMRDAKVTQIFEGTNQIQRQIIAKSIRR
ncbi:acyl-CoA dehydrogenase family protein [Bdellovibrionota bacterium]